MDITTLSLEIERSLRTVPALDVHTHLDATHLCARGLHDVLLYHMVVSDLVSGGCPDRSRLPESPSDAETATRIQRALPFLPGISNTSCAWGLRIILEDLFGWKKPLTAGNWKKLDGLIREHAQEPGRAHSIQERAGISRSVTELWRRHDGSADAMLQYSLEWAFFGRAQWGEFDTALWELEKAWSEGAPAAPTPIGPETQRPVPARTIRSVRDIHEGLDAYVAAIPREVLGTAQHLSTDIDFTPVDEPTVAAAIRRRPRAGRAERDLYASYIMEEFFTRLEAKAPGVIFQFSLGAESLPAETASRLSQATLAWVAEMVARHPGIRFQCYLSSAHANQALCTIARELPNFSLAGYWWHNFFPSFIERVIRERLDMLAASRQVGFFSDAYTVEWSYAKAVMVRRMLARVLADKVAHGQYDRSTALGVARQILFDAPQQLMGMKPAALGGSRGKGRRRPAR